MAKEVDLEKLRHSLAHLLAAAVLEIWPEIRPTIGPAIDNGFYYDFDFGDKKITDADLAKIEKGMKKLLPSWHDFKKIDVTAEEAEKIFAANTYKLELIKELAEKGENITLYYSGPEKNFPGKNELLTTKTYNLKPGFLDLCRGGHVEDMQKLEDGSWKLDRIAGAYWRGDEKNKMLTRIYGLAFGSKKELADYLALREEAEKRDHKKLGKELDLFVFSDLVGSGLPLWTPKGTLIRNLLDNYVWELRERAGYQLVDIPHLAKKELYETSGHWQKFENELFKITTREGHTFALKPMNCPHHTQIYARRQWSYRELPQRYATTTKVYRDEQSGELSGLARVRAITQDDAHVFCRYDQADGEVKKIWQIIKDFYGTFNMPIHEVRLSLHDPKEPEKYLGSPEVWKKAEENLRQIAKTEKTKFVEKVGEAAFYGPKVDFMVRDSIGREWQVATIQLDMNMPERFDLFCINEAGEHERIVMIHCAIMGSIERFMVPLIEHYAGAFPTWLSPVQVIVIPISDKQKDYAAGVATELKTASVRVEVDDSNETLGKRLRTAKLQKIPYIIIVGEMEVKSNKIKVEKRQSDEGQVSSSKEFITQITKEIRDRK